MSNIYEQQAGSSSSEMAIKSLDYTNWISCKRQILCTLDRQGLRGIITGSDPRPAPPSPARDYTTNAAPQSEVGCSTEYSRQLYEWEVRNSHAYSHLVRSLSPAMLLLLGLDLTPDAHTTWTVLLDRFESEDAYRIPSMLRKYESCHRKANQSAASFISEINDLRSQLTLLGETIEDSVHAAKLLRNTPESWWTVIGLIKAGQSGMEYFLSHQRLKPAGIIEF